MGEDTDIQSIQRCRGHVPDPVLAFWTVPSGSSEDFFPPALLQGGGHECRPGWSISQTRFSSCDVPDELKSWIKWTQWAWALTGPWNTSLLASPRLLECHWQQPQGIMWPGREVTRAGFPSLDTIHRAAEGTLPALPQLLVSRETSLATGAAWLLLWRELELVTTEDGIELSGVQEQLGAHSRSHSTSLPGASIKPQGGPRAVESSRCTSQKPFCISFCGMFPPNKEAITTLSLPSSRI